MDNNFLDTENFKYLINFVFNDIQQKTNIDISNSKKYINIFKKLVQTVHVKNINKRVSKEYLNNLVIDKCVPFIIKQLTKENSKNNTMNNNRPITISERPMASKKPVSNNNDFSHLTLDGGDGNNVDIVNNIAGISSRNGEKIDFSSKMKEYQNNRQYDDPMRQRNENQIKSVNEMIGKQSNDEEKIDFAKKMREIENERNYANQNNSMVEFSNQNNMENIKNHEALQNVQNQNVPIDNSFMEQLYENNKNADFNPELLSKLSNNYLNDPTEDEDNLINSYQNIEMKIKDRSENDHLPTYDSNINNLKIDYTSEKITNDIQNTEKELYQATKKYNRNPAHLIVLSNETLFAAADDVQFQANLIEPIILDKPADLYLEFINLQSLTGNGDAHLESVNCFALKIDEFNLSTASNINDLKDKYIIPNDSFGTTDNVADADNDANNQVNATSYNIKLKSNYMCTINPMEISSLNISLYGFEPNATQTFNFLKSIDNTSRVVLGILLKKH